MRKLISMLTAASLMVFSIIPLSIGAKTNEELLNYENNGEYLGIASAFSVFVEEDFGANGCDCEGRIFAGHSANVGEVVSYAVKEDSGASVIISDGILSNFDIGNRIFVYGSNGETQLTGDNIYQADLIAAHEEFEILREKSRNLSQNNNNGEIKINPYWNAEIDFVGTDPDFNIFNLDSNMIDSCNYFFNYEVPEGSYVIINIAGQNLTTYTQLYGMQYAGHRVTNNKDEVSKHILFNFYEAENLTIAGTGTLYGTVFAPFANAGDDITEGAHNAGGIVAKNYIGGIEFGNCTYDGGEPDEVQIPTETIETTATTSTTTTSAIAISTGVSTFTSKEITTTERKTETSFTTSTSRATTPLSTTTTSTTNLKTNTTSSTNTATSTTTNTTSTTGTTTSTTPKTTTGTTTSITSTTGSTERPSSSSTTITTTKQTTTSITSTTPRATETTTTNRETTTLATTTTEIATTTTGEVEGTTEVSTHPTALDWATDTQTSEVTTIETQTSESETTANTIAESTGTSTTICSSGSSTTESSTTSTGETTIESVESAKTGDSMDIGKIAGTCGLAMIVGLLAVCGKKEE